MNYYLLLNYGATTANQKHNNHPKLAMALDKTENIIIII